MTSHNSCLKNVSIKYHHIFWKVYPGYFRKFPIWDKCVLVHYGSFSQEINGKSAKFAVWAVSLIFLFDFTLFMIDIYQIMHISLFPTPFDHFHFYGSNGLISWYDLRLWRIEYCNKMIKLGPNSKCTKLLFVPPCLHPTILPLLWFRCIVYICFLCVFVFYTVFYVVLDHLCESRYSYFAVLHIHLCWFYFIIIHYF